MNYFCFGEFLGGAAIVVALEIIYAVKFFYFSVKGYIDRVLVLVFEAVFGGKLEQLFDDAGLPNLGEIEKNNARVYIKTLEPERFFVAHAFYVNVARARAVAAA